MRKTLAVLVVFVLLLAHGAFAGTEAALEACRAENGLLPDVPGGGVYSAEVLVREMRLRVLRGDRERFDALYRLMTKHFQSPLLLMYPRLNAALRPTVRANHTSVDLLACRVLLDAAVRWDAPEFRTLARRVSQRILRFNVYLGALSTGASWKERASGFFTLYGPSHEIALDMVDIRALQQLQELSGHWDAVAQRCLGILLAGSDTREHRFIYDLDKRAYLPSPGGAVAELWIMTHLIEGGLAPLRSLARLRAQVKDDPLALARGENGSLTAAVLGGYMLGRAGYRDESRRVFLALAEVADGGLLRREGHAPLISDTLLYLTALELLGFDDVPR